MIERCTDDDLRAVMSDNPDPRAKLAAEELLAIRSDRRRDSRRGEQVKKLRWTVENFVTKLEAFTALAKQWEAEGMSSALGNQPAPGGPR